MGTKMKFQKSLPPLVEGKIHGYLKLVIDEIIWLKRSFSEIKIFLTWWGETNRTEFRSIDVTKDVIKSQQETTEIYAIRTNINLFEEYIKNCEPIEVIIINKETNKIIGTSQITDLLQILKYKSYFKYIPIITNYGTKIGEIHISMKLKYMTKSFNMQLKTHKYEKKQADHNILISTNSFKNQDNIMTNECNKKEITEENNTYKSILKLRRTEFQEPINKLKNDITDKIIAQIVTKAQQLRGALYKKTYDEDELIFNNNSINELSLNELQTNISIDDEVKLHECFLNKDMMLSNESKTHTSTSLNSSLIDLTSNSLKTSKYDNKSTINGISSTRMNSLMKDTFSNKKLYINSKDTELFDFITYIQINIESFTLSPAGYRRVKSSSISHKDDVFLSATYFVQYDIIFDHIDEFEKKNKTVRISSKKQANQDGATTDSSSIVKNVSQSITEIIDDKKMDTKNYKNTDPDKVLLHGLIYVFEGLDLSELNTYLICRAFWKEDKTKSQICNNTKNPSYQFCQLIPLIYDNDLLERIKDNYIIIEVYSRNNNIDNLLGLTKLSVHQLYVAYRDPRVLSYLILSKYPVISVDGWVPIIDPVSGQSCGQLLALVALGTAEQIALLKMSRNLQSFGISQIMNLNKFFDFKKQTQDMQHSIYKTQLNKEEILENNSQIYTTNTIEKELYFPNSESRECQTDISIIKELKFNGKLQKNISNSEYSILHTVDYLTRVSSVNKNNIDQATQTDIDLKEKKPANKERIYSNEMNSNNSFDDSDNSSIKHNFYLPTEIYRSVGVGAEYNEEINQQPNSNHSNTTFELSTIIQTENESTNSTYSQTMFRAIVEIECALHLPKIEKIDGTIDPSTYVSFQVNQSNHASHLNSYMITNVFPYSCNPKWNWKCDTQLPTELLLYDKKRLILKIWRILDTDISMQINLENDVVLGFSAIDLSILKNGFPTVSGWFHIMDFTGKCNGQIKVCITPLDNLSLFGKSITRLPTYSMTQLNKIPLYAHEMHSHDIERNNTNYTLSTVVQKEEKLLHNENQSNDSNIHIDFEDVSMSFLSLSLKQKLTELDEITKRLKSRLHDITSTAFEDDLENEFELNELTSNNRNNDHKIIEPVVPIAAMDYNNKICLNRNTKENENENISNDDTTKFNIQNFLSKTYISCDNSVSCEIIKHNSSKILNSYDKRNLLNDNSETQQQNEHLMQNIKTLDDTFIDYPKQGTKAHINYLLDKLSSQFPTQSYLTKVMPMEKDITNVLTNLPNNSCLQDTNQELKIFTSHTKMDNIQNSITNSMSKEVDIYDQDSQIANKMSTVIREELIAEENSNTSKCDELTTYLITSNIRHMDLNNICNLPLYQHLMPDLYYPHISLEEETIKQLDNRYSKEFDTSKNNKLNKIHDLRGTNISIENTNHFRTTPSGISENIISDFIGFHDTNYNDQLANNSTESTTTISIANSIVKSIDSEIVENGDSISFETSDLVLPRQAPDGGNPIEDNKKSLITQENEILHS
ncbi:uncharacterized protein LOC725376 isoform X3 [Apis mellifera]|uniref:Uncharacterized protein LOC725376 isoform X3 n=1 Tax=Apis mellifera TaxID=7460 RepID=A0A7M7MWP6_APIME|nr:uncharacterized protein LOC725376 isoform X3 [Apis mellifera]|eukprot:XP_026302177.1 uncharacterized protein LOC725376 isoform X3 [Apis mellifera]